MFFQMNFEMSFKIERVGTFWALIFHSLMYAMDFKRYEIFQKVLMDLYFLKQMNQISTLNYQFLLYGTDQFSTIFCTYKFYSFAASQITNNTIHTFKALCTLKIGSTYCILESSFIIIVVFLTSYK